MGDVVLSATQQTQLEATVQDLNPNLQIEAASLDAEQTLELVLCRDFICFRPLRISVQEVDIPAALSGQSEAQHALQTYLRTALPGLL